MAGDRRLIDEINIFKTYYRKGRNRPLSDVSNNIYMNSSVVLQGYSHELIRASMKLVSTELLGYTRVTPNQIAFYITSSCLSSNVDFFSRFFHKEDLLYLKEVSMNFPFYHFTRHNYLITTRIRSHRPFPAYPDAFIALDPLANRANINGDRPMTFDTFASLRNFLSECLASLEEITAVDKSPKEFDGDIYELFG